MPNTEIKKEARRRPAISPRKGEVRMLTRPELEKLLESVKTHPGLHRLILHYVTTGDRSRINRRKGFAE